MAIVWVAAEQLSLSLWRADGKRKIVYLSTRELMAPLYLDSLALTWDIWGNTQIR